MTTTANPATKTQPRRQQLPAGLHWSKLWRTPDGTVIQGEIEVPVDADGMIGARLWMCPVAECGYSVWTFGDGADDDPACCRKHPAYLEVAPLSPADRNPVAGARSRLAARAAGLARSARDRALEVANAKLEVARQNVAETSKRTAADMRGHLPSLVASGGLLAGSAVLAHNAHPAVTLAVGVAVGTAGAVAAYVLVWLREKWRARRDGVELVGRAARRMRARARHIASAGPATGLWLAGAAAVGVDLRDPLAALWLLIVGPLLSWLVNKTHWDKLWADRARLRELARQKAEAAARRAAEEAERAAQPEPVAQVAEDTPEAMGAWLAAEWARIATAPTVPTGLPLQRTWILPAETRPVTAPIDGEMIRIGWEFTGQCEPGALVGRPGLTAPLVAAREWLAAMLERNPSTVEVVDRPDGQINRFVILLTDRAPLGGVVPWKGRSGVRVGDDGTIYVHGGTTIQGEVVEEVFYVPGQPFGGLDVGTTGGGKTAGTVLQILNALVAGIFPILDDPKQLLSYGDFVGVFPIGVTLEHSKLITESLHAERRRREKHLSMLATTDRHGRRRRQDPVWDVKRDGPPLLAIFDEFHMRSKDTELMGALTEQVRLQRQSAIGVKVVTQGGGLADLNNSEIRALLNQTRLRLYRMADNLARLAGYSGIYMPSQLPRIAGVCIDQRLEAPPVPLRAAYVHQGLEDGSVFDQLYGPNMEQLLTAPSLPKETVEVWERTGLMDLWRLGQGPDGLDRLLSDVPGPEGLTPPPETTAAAGDVPRLAAEDVLLAILHTSGGQARRAVLDTHETWLRPAAGGVPVAPSTISRAAGRLEKKGLITRSGPGPTRTYQLTAKGEEPAKAAVAVLLLGGPPVAHTRAQDPVTPLRTAADVEREAELLAEQQAAAAP